MFRFPNVAPLGRGGNALTGGAAKRRGSALFPPHLFPPPGATAIFKSDTLATAGAGIYSPPGLVFQIPKGYIGVLRVLSPFVDNPTAATLLTWTVRVNGIAPNGLNGLTIIGRDASSIEKVFDQYSLELPEGAAVDVQIAQLDVGAYRVGMQLEGWYYNTESINVE